MEHTQFTELPELQIRECPLTIQCPHCAFVYSDPEIKRLWSAYTRSRRTVFKAGPGRPRKYDHNEKCICGRPMHGPNGVKNRPKHTNPADGLRCGGIGTI